MYCRKCAQTVPDTDNALCPFCGADLSHAEALARADMKEALRLLKLEKYEEAAEKMHAASECGLPEATYRYGRMLERGIGVRRSLPDAIVAYKAAASAAHPDAAFAFSRLLSFGEAGEGRAVADAADLWLSVSAYLGSAEGEEALGRSIIRARGDVTEEALYWLDSAARHGSIPAAQQLAEHYAGEEGSAAKQYCKWYRALSRALRRGGEEEVVSKKLCAPRLCAPESFCESVFALGKRASEISQPVVAAKLYKIAADKGYPRAQNAYAICLENGRGVKKDTEAALRIYEAAAEAGFDLAKLNLGDLYRAGEICPHDPERAFDLYMSAAEDGSARAQYIVANCYFSGDLVARDFSEAMKWYQRSAMQGFGKAILRAEDMHSVMTMMFNRARAAYDAGDYRSAFRFYTISSEMGHKGASCNLGYMYQSGLGCKRNRRLAAHCFELSALAGSTAGAYNLGMCYLCGRGKGYDHKAAKRWLTVAKEGGHSEAETALRALDALRTRTRAQKYFSISSVMYRRGDIENALIYRAMAAKLGLPRAQYILGCHFEFGDGVEEDRTAARMWYTRAVQSGFTKTFSTKDSYLRQMKLAGRK